MNQTSTDKSISIKEDLLKKISSNQVSMRPKMYFTLRLTVLIVLASLVLGISAFLFNLILFSIHAQATAALLGFGSRGWISFLNAFPWSLLLIDIACMAAFYVIGRRFNRAYRTPIMWNVMAIIVVTVAAGAVIEAATPVNGFLGDDHAVYVPSEVHDLYSSYGRHARPIGGTCLCNIVSIGTSTFTVWNEGLGTSTQFLIIVPADEPYATTTGLAVGDTVIIAGVQEVGRNGPENVIQAFGIKRIDASY